MEHYSAIKWNEITTHATAGGDLKRIRLSGKRPTPKCYTHKEKNLRNVDQIHRYQGLGTRRGGEVHKETGMETDGQHEEPYSDILHFDCGSIYTIYT